MSQEENIKWLFEKAAQANPNHSKWESNTQTIALWKAINPNINLEPCDMLCLGCAGWLVSLARLLDEEKFSEIPPTAYLQVAHVIINKEAGEEEWRQFCERLTGTNINKA